MDPVAAGRDARLYLSALEQFAQGAGLIPEQVWDAPDLPSKHLCLGGGTGSAVPLVWAHAEYLKLQRSAADAKVFDLVEPVFDRYVRGSTERQPIEVWKSGRQIPTVAAGARLRIQASGPFLLHWTNDEWQHATDIRSKPTAVGVEFVDLVCPEREEAIRFTFLWLDDNRWEGKDYTIYLQAGADRRMREAVYEEPRRAA